MPKSRAPWWMVVVAGVYALTLGFNARQEAWGPAAAGWKPAWPTLRAAAVVPGSPMEKAGLRKGDVIESVDGRSLNGMTDWFVARAHFERDHPVEIQVRRGDQRLRLRFVITLAEWRSWRIENVLVVSAFYIARFILLFLAIVVAFMRADQMSARLAGLMLASASVAEGYPSSGWAAALRHVPAVVAIPICLASASWLLGSIAWLAFFAIFPRPRFTRPWQWGLLIVPLIVFVPLMVTSSVALIYAPTELAFRPVRLVQDLVGVAPLLFFNAWQPHILELWLAVTVLFLVAGFALLVFDYRQLPEGNQRRAVGTLIVCLMIFAMITVHNFFTRNWTSWFGTPAPAVFSYMTYFVEAVLFMFSALSLAYAVLTEGGDVENGFSRLPGIS